MFFQLIVSSQRQQVHFLNTEPNLLSAFTSIIETCFLFTYAHENFHFHMILLQKMLGLNYYSNNVPLQMHYECVQFFFNFQVCIFGGFSRSYCKSDLHRLTQLNSTLQAGRQCKHALDFIKLSKDLMDTSGPDRA